MGRIFIENVHISGYRIFLDPHCSRNPVPMDILLPFRHSYPFDPLLQHQAVVDLRSDGHSSVDERFGRRRWSLEPARTTTGQLRLLAAVAQDRIQRSIQRSFSSIFAHSYGLFYNPIFLLYSPVDIFRLNRD